MEIEINSYIRNATQWDDLPISIRNHLRDSEKEYDRMAISYHAKNQIRFRGSLVQHLATKIKEQIYYEKLVEYSREHLLLYPYHLQDITNGGLRLTAFSYYIKMLEMILLNDRNYDCLPNFTASDCLRLCGIGRNEYIELMNRSRAQKGFFKRIKTPAQVREFLPTQPLQTFVIQPWWIMHAGLVYERDVFALSEPEKSLIDLLVDVDESEGVVVGKYSKSVVAGLYRKGLVYFDVPVDDSDRIVIPTLEGFVMNRVQGDYFESLLYQIAVTSDENSTIAQLADTLSDSSIQLIKRAVSFLLRLNFARKKALPGETFSYHDSWKISSPADLNLSSPTSSMYLSQGDGFAGNDLDFDQSAAVGAESSPTIENKLETSLSQGVESKRLCLLYDSCLTAFLMMGNLTPNLKNHAVTMFEVGKLNDESLDSFLGELDKVNIDGEGDAERYFIHAILLRNTLRALRYKPYAIDLIRCESLHALEPATCMKLLTKNYDYVITLSPLSPSSQCIRIETPPHIGTFMPELNSIWLKLYLFHVLSKGPRSLLLTRGSRVKRLPKIFNQAKCYFNVTPWKHESSILQHTNFLLSINDILQHSSVLIHEFSDPDIENAIEFVSFPFRLNAEDSMNVSTDDIEALRSQSFPLTSCPGFLTLDRKTKLILNCDFGLALNDASVNSNALAQIQACLTNENTDQYRIETSAFEKLFIEFMREWGGDETCEFMPCDNLLFDGEKLALFE